MLEEKEEGKGEDGGLVEASLSSEQRQMGIGSGSLEEGCERAGPPASEEEVSLSGVGS